MILTQLSEVILNFTQTGRVSAARQNYSQSDILQYSKMAYGNIMRTLYYEAKKTREGDEYYFFSGDLFTKRFKLGDTNFQGMRRAEIPDEVVRLPKNADIVNIYPVGGGECGTGTVGEITQVQPGEENFYLSPDFSSFQFFVQKGKGVNLYHIPPCVKQIDVERIFVTDDMEISLDLCFDIANQVLGVTLRVPGFANAGVDDPYTPQQLAVKKTLQQTQNG